MRQLASRATESTVEGQLSHRFSAGNIRRVDLHAEPPARLIPIRPQANGPLPDLQRPPCRFVHGSIPPKIGTPRIPWWFTMSGSKSKNPELGTHISFALQHLTRQGCLRLRAVGGLTAICGLHVGNIRVQMM